MSADVSARPVGAEASPLRFPRSAIAKPRMARPAQQDSLDLSTYTVKPGDTVSAIARRLGVSTAALLAANPQITRSGGGRRRSADGHWIYAGDVLRVPPKGQPGPATLPAAKARPVAQHRPVVHKAAVQNQVVHKPAVHKPVVRMPEAKAGGPAPSVPVRDSAIPTPPVYPAQPPQTYYPPQPPQTYYPPQPPQTYYPPQPTPIPQYSSTAWRPPVSDASYWPPNGTTYSPIYPNPLPTSQPTPDGSKNSHVGTDIAFAVGGAVVGLAIGALAFRRH